MTTGRLFGVWLGVTLSLAAVGVVVGEGLAVGALVAIPLMLASFAFCRRFGDGFVRLLLLAVTIRFVVAAAIHFLVYPSHPGLFAPDELGYDRAGKLFAEFLAGHIAPAEIADIDAPAFVWLVGLCYHLFGHAPMLPKLLIAIAGAWTAVLAALIARRFFSPAVSYRTGLFAALTPSLVLWSSLLLKDTWTLLGSEMAILAVLHLGDRLRMRFLALAAVGLIVIYLNRPYEVAFVLVAGAGMLFVGSKRRLFRAFAVTVMFAIVLYFVLHQTSSSQFVSGTEGRDSIEQMTYIRNAYTDDAGSAINVQLVDISTPLGLLLWVPIGLGYFFLAPIPFTGTSIISLATSPEMLAWYYLLPSLVRGAIRLKRARALRPLVPLILFVLIASISWSVVAANVGTLYRYRSQVLFVPLMLIALDQETRRTARNRANANPTASHLNSPNAIHTVAG